MVALPGVSRSLALTVYSLSPTKLVGVGRPAVLHVEAPTAEAAALAEDDAVRAAGGKPDHVAAVKQSMAEGTKKLAQDRVG